MTRALVALLTLAACSQLHGADGPEPAPEPASPPLVLRFRWPVPTAAVVHAVSVREEATVESRFRISVAAGEDEQLVLSYGDFAILGVNGIEPSDFHTVAADMDRVVNVAAVRPSVRIERSGMSTGLVDADATLAEMIVARAEDDPVMADQLVAKLAEPLARKVFVHQHTRPWRHWVESWLGLELYPAKAGYGVVVTPEVKARHGVGTRQIIARAKGADPAVLELEKRFWVDGEAGRELINAGLEPVFGLLGIPEMVEVHDVTVEASITAVMDVRTLQPQSVRSHLVARARTDLGVIEHEQLDTYEIEWLAADEPLLEAAPEPGIVPTSEVGKTPELVVVPVEPTTRPEAKPDLVVVPVEPTIRPAAKPEPAEREPKPEPVVATPEEPVPEPVAEPERTPGPAANEASPGEQPASEAPPEA